MNIDFSSYPFIYSLLDLFIKIYFILKFIYLLLRKDKGQVKRAQGRSKKTWMKVIRQDIEAKGHSEGILLDKNEWRKLIHVPDPA